VVGLLEGTVTESARGKVEKEGRRRKGKRVSVDESQKDFY